MAQTESIRNCDQCCRTLVKEQEWVGLEPCPHILCPKCFIDCLLTQGRFNALQCPVTDCWKVVENHIYHAWDIDQNAWVQSTTPHNPRSRMPSLQRDPLRYFNALGTDERRGKMTVALGFQASEADQDTYLAVCLDYKKGATTQEERRILKDILNMLHLVVFSVTQDYQVAEDPPPYPHLSPTELKFFAIYEDRRFTTELLHAFISGNPNRDDDVKVALTDQLAQAKLLGTSSVTEIALRLLHHFEPQRLQIAIGKEVAMILETSRLQELLSNLRLSMCSVTARDQKYKFLINQAGEGIKVDPRDFPNWPVDNIEFKGRGKVDSWCNILMQISREAELKEDLFYHKDPSMRLSRDDGKDFMSLVEDEGAEAIVERLFVVSDLDWLQISNRKLQHIDMIKQLILPDANECRQRAEDETYDCNESIPLNLGVILPEQQKNLAEKVNQTMYERNNLHFQTPYHASFAKKDSIMEISLSAKRTVDNLLKKHEEELGDDHPEGPPVLNLMVSLEGDGYPCEQWLRAKAHYRSIGDLSIENIYWWSGNFHLKMNGYGSLNLKLFRDILKLAVSRWRPTSHSFEYLLHCNAPKVVEDEMFQYLCAHYRNAADQLETIKGRKVSAKEIHEHMLKRAKAHPLCMAFYLHNNFLEVLLMLRDSEKSGDKGDVELAMSAQRFLLIVFAAAHAPKYLRIECDFLKWWECADSARRQLYVRFLFTMLSSNGRPMFMDLGVEKTIRDMRRFMKHRVRPGMEGIMYSEVPQIPARMKTKCSGRGRHSHDEDNGNSTSWNARIMKIGKPYIETYLLLEELNAWGEGEVNQAEGNDGNSDGIGAGCDHNDDDDNDGDDDGNSKSTLWAIDGNTIAADLLSCASIGIRRIRHYGLHWEVNNPDEEKRTEREGEPQFPLINSRAGRGKTDLEKEIRKQTACEARVLEALGTYFTKREILEELGELREAYSDIIGAVEFDRNAKKRVLIDLLCDLRKIFFAQFPEAEQDRIDVAEAQARRERTSSRADREQEITDVLFLRLHPDANITNNEDI